MYAGPPRRKSACTSTHLHRSLSLSHPMWLLRVLVALTVTVACVVGEMSMRPQAHRRAMSSLQNAAAGVSERRASASQPTSGATRSLEPRRMRSVPLKTYSPMGVYLPSFPGDKGSVAGDGTRVYFLGTGFRSETSIWALVTGKKGVGNGPATSFLFNGPSALQMANVERTVDTGNGTVTGRFGFGCELKSKTFSSMQCKLKYQTSDITSEYTTYFTKTNPVTTVTPIHGLLQHIQQKEATHTLSEVPDVHVQNAARVLHRPAGTIVALAVVLVTTAGAFLL